MSELWDWVMSSADLPNRTLQSSTAGLSSRRTSDSIMRQDRDDSASIVSGVTSASDLSLSKRHLCHVCKQPTPGSLKTASAWALHSCSTCPRRYHRRCHNRPEIPMNPRDDWQCYRCVNKESRLSSRVVRLSRDAKGSMTPTELSKASLGSRHTNQTGAVESSVAHLNGRKETLPSRQLSTAVLSTPPSAKSSEIRDGANETMSQQTKIPAAASAEPNNTARLRLLSSPALATTCPSSTAIPNQSRAASPISESRHDAAELLRTTEIHLSAASDCLSDHLLNGAYNAPLALRSAPPNTQVLDGSPSRTNRIEHTMDASLEQPDRNNREPVSLGKRNPSLKMTCEDCGGGIAPLPGASSRRCMRCDSAKMSENRPSPPMADNGLINAGASSDILGAKIVKASEPSAESPVTGGRASKYERKTFQHIGSEDNSNGDVDHQEDLAREFEQQQESHRNKQASHKANDDIAMFDAIDSNLVNGQRNGDAHMSGGESAREVSETEILEDGAESEAHSSNDEADEGSDEEMEEDEQNQLREAPCDDCRWDGVECDHPDLARVQAAQRAMARKRRQVRSKDYSDESGSSDHESNFAKTRRSSLVKPRGKTMPRGIKRRRKVSNVSKASSRPRRIVRDVHLQDSDADLEEDEEDEEERGSESDLSSLPNMENGASNGSALKSPRRRRKPGLSQVRQAVDELDLGDWEFRPKGTYEKLCAMALDAAPQYRTTPKAAVQWIVKNIPGYGEKKGNWRGSIGATLASRRLGSSSQGRKGLWTRIAVPGGKKDSTIYELVPEAIGNVYRWDPVARMPIPPPGGHVGSSQSTPKTPSTRFLSGTKGATSIGKRFKIKIKAPVYKPRNAAKKLIGKRPLVDKDGKKATNRKGSRRKSAPDVVEPDDREGSGTPSGYNLRATRRPTSHKKSLEGGHTGDLEDYEMNFEADASDEMDVGLGDGARTAKRRKPPHVTFADVTEARLSRKDARELATRDLAWRTQQVKLFGRRAEFTAKSLYEGWPEYDPTNRSDVEAKIAEIKLRPKRKERMRQRLRDPWIDEPVCAPTRTPNAQSALNQPEKGSRMSAQLFPWEEGDENVKSFSTAKEFFDLPDSAIAVLHRSEIVFRDGARNTDGTLPRAKVLYRTGIM